MELLVVLALNFILCLVRYIFLPVYNPHKCYLIFHQLRFNQLRVYSFFARKDNESRHQILNTFLKSKHVLIQKTCTYVNNINIFISFWNIKVNINNLVIKVNVLDSGLLLYQSFWYILCDPLGPLQMLDNVTVRVCGSNFVIFISKGVFRFSW